MDIHNDQSILENNRIFYNKHQEERCFILATGPSIKKQNLKLLAGEICIAVSNFFVHPDYNAIKPRYYCVAPCHSPITEEAWQVWMKEMAQGTLDATMFFGLSDQRRVEANGYFANRLLHYLAFGTSEEVLDSMIDSGGDISSTVIAPQSVSVMALTIAIYMGFRTIYLLGCDHDWLCHMHESKHFYEEKEHAMVRQGYNEWTSTSVEFECQCMLSLWQQYKILKYLAENKGTDIFNATGGGLLDVFPRANFE